jgi:hypothetical protein
VWVGWGLGGVVGFCGGFFFFGLVGLGVLFVYLGFFFFLGVGGGGGV